MQALAQVTAQMAQFIASVFGTTAQQAQENAKELNKQTDALEFHGIVCRRKLKRLLHRSIQSRN